MKYCTDGPPEGGLTAAHIAHHHQYNRVHTWYGKVRGPSVPRTVTERAREVKCGDDSAGLSWDTRREHARRHRLGR